MTWHKDGPGARRGYHHGNLREALIAAALDLISKKGAAGFTFADAARAAGVSPAAPYRHFRDRDALMADVARRGFEGFATALAGAWDGGKPSPRTAFERVGRAYLRFAEKEPALFSAMFEFGPCRQRVSRAARSRRPRLHRVARSLRGGGGHAAEGASSPVLDDGAAHLVAEPRHRGAVCARRRRAPRHPDDAGGALGGRRAHLSRRSRRPARPGTVTCPSGLSASKRNTGAGAISNPCFMGGRRGLPIFRRAPLDGAAHRWHLCKCDKHSHERLNCDDSGCGNPRRSRPSRVDCRHGRWLHPVLADRPRNSGLLAMERTHGMWTARW